MLLKVVIGICAFTILYGVFIERNLVEVKRIDFGNEYQIKFIHISDLHFSRESYRERKILKIIDDEKPDLIFITGDIVNFRKKFVGENYLRKIASLSSKIFFVFGNWEYRSKDILQIKKSLEDIGINVLENSGVTFRKFGKAINIVGVSDPYTNHDDLKKAVDNINLDNYTILLSHSPDIFYKAVDYKINLVLTGHLHGGQVKFPFIKFAIYSPSKYGLYFLGGLFKNGSTEMYVNRGIGESHFPIRICARPEVLIGKL